MSAPPAPAGSAGARLAPYSLKPVVRSPTRERTSDRVYDELSSAIRDLRLPPGALLSETRISRQLGVSRTPLREAISRLVDQGLVRVVPQVGTTVALIDMREVEEACFIRSSLETAAFRRACEMGASVRGLRRILESQERAVADHDPEGFFVTDEALHQEIFRLSGFPRTWSIVRNSKIQLDRLRRLIIPHVVIRRDTIDEHIGIVDHMEAGDTEAGVALITEHSQHVLTLAPGIRADRPTYFTE